MCHEFVLKRRFAVLTIIVVSLCAISVSTAEAFVLDIYKSGTGTGTVTSIPAGIDCGGACSHDFGATTDIVIEAVADGSSVFTGWSGCASESGNECTVSMVEDGEVYAFFDLLTTASYFVSTSGNDDYSGKGWSRPFRTIDQALSVAESGEEIWVRRGTYYPPVVNESSYQAYFVISKKVHLFGGFNGDETERGQRDWENNQTIVNAYQAWDWGQGFYINTVGDTEPGRARIDGFVVERGHAKKNYPVNAGGGIYVKSGMPIIANSEIKNNQAVSGGGIYGGSHGTTIINCKIHDNSVDHYGGGIEIDQNGEVINSVVYGNRADFGSGGGIAFWRGGTIKSSTITGNRATFSTAKGGGVSGYFDGTTTITNSIIWGNTTSGGAPSELYVNSSASAVVSYSNIRGGFVGTGNVDSNPLFGYIGTTGLTPQSFSSGVNNGDNTLLPADIADLDGDGDSTEALPVDIYGYDRVTDGTVDMGAHEYAAGRYNEYPLSVSVNPPGMATISLSGSECAAPCTVNCFEDTGLTIEVAPGDPYRFAYWVGCYRDWEDPQKCSVNIDEATDITVHLVEKTADSDSDEIEDWWEYYYFEGLSRDGTGDYDNDGMSDRDEYDLDCKPNNQDSDNDGMDDGWEQQFGLDPLDEQDGSSDDDGDGKDNLQEFQAGTNPVPLCGDISDDAVVDVTDLILTLKVLSGESVVPVPGGDCNSDDIIGIDEALTIIQEVVEE